MKVLPAQCGREWGIGNRQLGIGSRESGIGSRNAASSRILRPELEPECGSGPDPNSRFPIPDSRFPVRDSRFPILRRIVLTYICAWLAACTGSTDPITVTDAWAPATPPGATVGAAYMQIEVRGTDTLVGFSSPVAETVELHRTSFEEGVAQMRKVDSVVVSADIPLRLEPNGMHLMFHGLSAPLEAGQHIGLTLHFQQEGKVHAEIPVMAPGAHPEHH